MAFVSRAERTLDLKPECHGEWGPGSYEQINTIKESSQAQSSVGFRSLAVRVHESENKTGPGPGCYSSPSLDKIELNQYGCSKVSSAFASESKRVLFKQPQQPGPSSADYELTKGIGKPKPKEKTQEWNNINWLRLPSAPSIPSNTQAFGYEETVTGDLVMQKNPEKVFSGRVDDAVGPGEYQPHVKDKTRAKKFNIWTMSRTNRYELKNRTITIGPGAYDKSEDTSPNKKAKSSVFASKTVRIAQAIKAKKTKKMATDVLDDNDSDSDDVASPGPGKYELEKTTTSFRTKSVPQRHQFFGSSDERFKKNLFGEVNESAPGQYDPHSNRSTSTRAKVPFTSVRQRFEEGVKYESPGPGSYGPEKPKGKKVWGRSGPFGATERRFTESIFEPERNNKSKTPARSVGPGQYQITPRKPSKQNTGGTAVFRSVKRRSASANKVHGVAPGFYDINLNFSPAAATKRKSQKAKIINNPIKQLNQKEKVGFGTRTKTKRFDMGPATEMGPGKYKDHSQFQPDHVKKQAGIFMPQCRRYMTTENKTNDPGSYFDGDTTAVSWNKKSFNIRFSEY